MRYFYFAMLLGAVACSSLLMQHMYVKCLNTTSTYTQWSMHNKLKLLEDWKLANASMIVCFF